MEPHAGLLRILYGRVGIYHLAGAAARSGSALAKAMYELMKTYHVNKKKGGRSSVQRTAKSGDVRSN